MMCHVESPRPKPFAASRPAVLATRVLLADWSGSRVAPEMAAQGGRNAPKAVGRYGFYTPRDHNRHFDTGSGPGHDPHALSDRAPCAQGYRGRDEGGDPGGHGSQRDHDVSDPGGDHEPRSGVVRRGLVQRSVGVFLLPVRPAVLRQRALGVRGHERQLYPARVLRRASDGADHPLRDVFGRAYGDGVARVAHARLREAEVLPQDGRPLRLPGADAREGARLSPLPHQLRKRAADRLARRGPNGSGAAGGCRRRYPLRDTDAGGDEGAAGGRAAGVGGRRGGLWGAQSLSVRAFVRHAGDQPRRSRRTGG